MKSAAIKHLIPFKTQLDRLIDQTPSLKSHHLYSGDFVRNELSWICKFAFDQNFIFFKSNYLPFMSQHGFKSPKSLLEYYESLLKSQMGWEQFVNLFPILPDICKTYCKKVEYYIEEIHGHYKNDQLVLSETFNNSVPLGDIESIELGKGDMHQGGRSTTIVYFKNGLKLVYKPRPGNLDQAFNSLLNEVNDQLNKIDLKVVKIYSRENYFWMQYMENSPCASVQELHQYYLNCGALLALIYLLRGTDMHFENIIANGSSPVIIDIECLFMSDKTEKYTVITTGLIPDYSKRDSSDSRFDGSGFGAQGKQEVGMEGWKWENLYTDALELVKVPGYIIAEMNQPLYEKRSISPQSFLAEIEEGFSIVCKWIIEKKISFPLSNPFARFKNQTVRFVPRSTQHYRNILENSYTPQALISGEKRNAEILNYLNEFPVAFLLNSLQLENLIRFECRDIENLDIPYFTINTSERDVFSGDEIVIGNAFERTPYEVVMDNINNLNDIEINIQLKILRSAFITKYHLDQSKLYLSKKKTI